MPMHSGARQSYKDFVRHTVPELCFAGAIDDHANFEGYNVPCYLYKQTGVRGLGKQVSQML